MSNFNRKRFRKQRKRFRNIIFYGCYFFLVHLFHE